MFGVVWDFSNSEGQTKISSKPHWQVFKKFKAQLSRLVFCKICVMITVMISQVKFQAEQANRDGNLNDGNLNDIPM